MTVVRGGKDTVAKLRRHAQRTARAWSLDGRPLLGVSVFATQDDRVNRLLRERFATFGVVYLRALDDLIDAGFTLLPTGMEPHYTVCLGRSDDAELQALLVALGSPRDNPQYGARTVWREEGWDVPR